METVAGLRVTSELFFVAEDYAQSSHPSCINTDSDAISSQTCIDTPLCEVGFQRQVKKSYSASFFPF